MTVDSFLSSLWCSWIDAFLLCYLFIFLLFKQKLKTICRNIFEMIVTESKKIFIKSPMFTFYSAIIGWYISSALCNASTKILLQTLPIPYSVSILQFFLAYQWSNVVWKWTSNPKLNIAVDQRKMLFLMSISYTIGFILVNTGFHLMHVSINETLRAAEPLFSVLLMTCSMTTQISR